MFVCPKCGTKDFPCWRGHRWTMYATYCKIDELEVWQPDVVKAVKEKKQVEMHGYFYNLIKRGDIVIRIHIELKDFWKRGHTEEKYRKAQDPSQRKLLELRKNEEIRC